jgi:5-methylcytosine-specific restriction endonuclease McrA
MGIFWDSNNWQTLCVSCHNRKTATEDGGGWGAPPIDR